MQALTNPQSALKDWIAEHQKANHEEVFLAQVMFVLVAYKEEWFEEDHSQHTPLRFAICNLYKGERMTSYPGGAIWDVNLVKDIKHRAYPVEFARLREKLAALKIKGERDMIRLGRVHHQSTRARGRSWHPIPEY